MNLYLVTIKSGRQAYVLASDPTKAYEIVLELLNEKNWYFTAERQLKSIELIAEHTLYPDCGQILLIEGEPLGN